MLPATSNLTIQSFYPTSKNGMEPAVELKNPRTVKDAHLEIAWKERGNKEYIWDLWCLAQSHAQKSSFKKKKKVLYIIIIILGSLKFTQHQTNK